MNCEAYVFSPMSFTPSYKDFGNWCERENSSHFYTVTRRPYFQQNPFVVFSKVCG